MTAVIEHSYRDRGTTRRTPRWYCRVRGSGSNAAGRSILGEYAKNVDDSMTDNLESDTCGIGGFKCGEDLTEATILRSRKFSVLVRVVGKHVEYVPQKFGVENRGFAGPMISPPRCGLLARISDTADLSSDLYPGLLVFPASIARSGESPFASRDVQAGRRRIGC